MFAVTTRARRELGIAARAAAALLRVDSVSGVTSGAQHVSSGAAERRGPSRGAARGTAAVARPAARRPAMRAFAEVLGAGTGDAAAALLLFFDDGRYVFECGDGTQRFCTERAVRLARLRGLFLTSLAPPSAGGLLGMVLTMADAGKRRVTVAAPDGLAAVLDAARAAAFCHRPSMETVLRPVGAAAEVVCDDENVCIRAVPVPAPPLRAGCSAEPAGYAVLSYVCRLKDIVGKFHPEKALRLGVPAGPCFGLLKKGTPVTARDGTVVNPSDVVSPSTAGPIVLVVACPALRYVAGVVDNPELCPRRLGLVCEKGSPLPGAPACVVYHRTPKDVLSSPEYVQWFTRFGSRVFHVTLHSTLAPERVVFASQAVDLDTLHSFDGKRFNAPWPCAKLSDANGMNAKSSGAPHDPAETFLRESLKVSTDQWLVGDCGARFTLSPTDSVGFDNTAVPPRLLDLPHTQKKIESELWRSVCEHGRETDSPPPSCLSTIDRTTAEVCFLGTAGAIPGKHRNVSGNLLNMFSRGSVLMDCGEGTWGQMMRAYGPKRARELLCGMNIVFISHIHADHHLGLLTLLYERGEALRLSGESESSRALMIIGPSQLLAWLNDYHATVYDDDVGAQPFKFVDARDLIEPQALQAQVFADSFGLGITCVEVIHCPNSFGCVLSDQVNGWSVVYSGDTRPCRALGTAGRGATLAIHEATLSDDMQEEAADKRHSTTSEALQVCGDWMGAWRTILTHFSQRYPRVPILDNSTMNSLRTNRATIAFDLMKVNFADLEVMPSITPAVRLAFPNEVPAS